MCETAGDTSPYYETELYLHVSEEIPSCWCGFDKSELLLLDRETQTLEYTASFENDVIAAMARTKNAVPSVMGIFYYEVAVLCGGVGGNIAVGFSAQTVSVSKLPGWEGVSFGYHGDDGLIYGGGNGNGTEYGPLFGEGDVVGCGVDYCNRKIFFTKNGVFLGDAFENISFSVPLYPAVGMRTHQEKTATNFTGKGLLFDIALYVSQSRKQLVDKMLEQRRGNPRGASETVLDYLMHNGFCQTVELFLQNTSLCYSESETQKMLQVKQESMQIRCGIYRLVCEGKLVDASMLLEKHFPQLHEGGVGFLLGQQILIEMIRELFSGKQSLKEKDERLLEIFEYGEQIEEATGGNGVRRKELEQTFSLVAYEDPFSSPYGSLLGEERRVSLGAVINKAILESKGYSAVCVLEQVLRQEETVFELLSTLKSGTPAMLGNFLERLLQIPRSRTNARLVDDLERQ